MDEEPVHREWTRTNGWRQGSVLTVEAAAALSLAHATDPENTCIVVASHDCDLANANLAAEPSAEVIVGRRVSAANKSLIRTKSPRTLHLEIEREGAAVAIELAATSKVLVPKNQLADWDPDPRYRLGQIGLDTLRHWLAIRYKRAAFPDEFDRRMHDVTKLADRLDRIVRAIDPIISGIYFRLDTLEERNPEDQTPYLLEIFLAYEPGRDPELSGDRAADAAESIRDSFKKKCFDEKENTWTHIRLVEITPVSEDDITVSQAKQLQQWRLEHFSLRSDTGSAIPFDLRA
jgi:hypothetical protein